MQFLLLGLAALALALLALNWFKSASPAVVAKRVRWIFIAVLLTGAALMAARGLIRSEEHTSELQSL